MRKITKVHVLSKTYATKVRASVRTDSNHLPSSESSPTMQPSIGGCSILFKHGLCKHWGLHQTSEAWTVHRQGGQGHAHGKGTPVVAAIATVETAALQEGRSAHCTAVLYPKIERAVAKTTEAHAKAVDPTCGSEDGCGSDRP